MSGSGGLDLAANSIENQAADDFGRGVGGAETTMQGVPVKLNMVNGPESEVQTRKQQTVDLDNSSAADKKSREKCILKNPQDGQGEPNSLMSTKYAGQEATLLSEKSCSCNDSLNKNCYLGHPSAHLSEADTEIDMSSKISKLKANATKGAGVPVDQRLTNGCCNCHGKETSFNMDEQGNIVSSVGNVEESEIHRIPDAIQDNLGNLTCDCSANTSGPLSDLTKMVENVCLESESTQEIEFTSSMEKFKPDPSQGTPPCIEHGATCGDLLVEMDQSFGMIGPAGADLDDTELEELPASLSDFVLGCHNNQYPVPPCPPNDSDINTIHIRKGPDEHPVTLVPYKSEVQMPDIMRLITKDLSEPYSIYTYRYFIHNWPQLCFLAMHQDKCVGAIVCKLDVHKKMARRGYIAMLAVDENYRKLQIGSSLVKKAIRAMVRGECDEVVLETEITNKPALRLYENLGFLRDKRLFRYYLNGVDALRLKLWLR